jgi:NAD(P)-dependent dehydrogenase (short-subunit alcohol dehydrogenase family)
VRSLDGRVAIVTGAGSGLGRAIAKELALQGASVVLTGRTRSALDEVAAEIAAVRDRFAIHSADVSDEQQASRLAEFALHEFGRIDLLCANVGIAGPTAPTWHVTTAEWNETFAVNVTGTFLCCRAVLPSMIEQRSGNVVITGSMSGKRPLPQRSPYAASKMALVGLTRTLAAEVGGFGISVNLVSPGPVAGPRLDAVLSRLAEARSVTVADVRASMLADAATGEFVSAGQVARTVAFLGSDAARGITGQDINVSGGIVMY